jgi:FtsZ-interacting cell division protein ZipA
MSEFQTSLLAIGALVVAGVLGYNKWQEHRARKAADQVFRSDYPDALVGEALDEKRPAMAAMESARRIEPGTVAAQQTFSDLPKVAEAVARVSKDPGADYVVEVAGEHQVDVSQLREKWSAVELRFARRALLEVLLDGQWGALPPGGHCPRVRASLQLVTRGGVVSEAELLEFRSEVETLASRLGLSASSPEMRRALEAARHLDQVCAAADIQIAFHVVSLPGEAFSGTKLRAAAEASGLAIDPEGRFSLADDRGRELFNLSDRSGARFLAAGMKDSAPQALTLCMDVPRAPETHRTFEAMARFAKTLANLLGGSVVDDNEQPLDERSVAAIGAQLAMVRASLEAEGIVPGSALALRLFS